jgi:hypothetical protein
MYWWNPKVYYAFSLFIRAALFPIVIPVRFYEFLKDTFK